MKYSWESKNNADAHLEKENEEMNNREKMRRDFLKITVLGAVILSLTSFAGANLPLSKRNKKPNIVLVFTDDQGWADTSVRMMKDRPDSRSSFFRTPALKKMAQEGIIFSNAYSPAPTCMPSRAGIQFGRFTK